MNILYILIGCSFALAVVFLLAYIWAVRNGQMDDDYTPSVRILFDEIGHKKAEQNNHVSSSIAEKENAEQTLITNICK